MFSHCAYTQTPEELVNAIHLDPTNCLARFSLGNMYAQQQNYIEAIEQFNEILKIRPHITSVLYNAAYCLKALGHFEDAIKRYNNVLMLQPDHGDARHGLSQAQLMLGNYEQAWENFEYRWSKPRSDSRAFVQYIHSGASLHNKTVLLLCEFGLGDTFQFIRYAQKVKELGARVIVQAQKPVIPILSLCPYIDQIVPVDTDIPAHDLATALMSLPFAFTTTIDTIPNSMPYLCADQKLIEYWKDHLKEDPAFAQDYGGRGKSFKIGICWNGNEYDQKVLQDLVHAKSIPLTYFESLSAIKSVSLYSLQKTSGTNQLKTINFKIHTFDENFDDSQGRFMDTAAVMKNMDLIITVDTSIAHLAGGLGVPVWLMLPHIPDWRWMIDGTTSPWYPTMKLFRQAKTGDWQSVMEEVKMALQQLIK